MVEGGDGAGKSTAIAALRAAYAARGTSVVVTREPGGTPEGLALRGLLLSASGTAWDPYAELLLMTAARVQHVVRVIRPALEAGQVVLCDRYVGSSLAYQGGGRGIDLNVIFRLHAVAVDDLWPHLTLWLDVDPEIGLARSRARLGFEPALDEGRFEALDLAFHQRVRRAYANLAVCLPGWVRIDAALERSVVSAAVVAAALTIPVSGPAGGG